MIKKQIADKLFKTELAEHKIELGLVDDLQRLKRGLDEALTEEMKMRTEASKLNSRAKALAKQYEGLVADAKSKAKEASNKLKDLGLPEPAILESIYDSFSVNIYKNIISEFR